MAMRYFMSLIVVVSIAVAQHLPAPTPKNPPLFMGDKNKKDEGTRVLRGVVRDPADNLAEGVIVKLKDTKSLSIRSFITKADGAYNFQGLSIGTDYELRAEKSDGSVSSTKTLSVFDTRREPVINLKLEPKK